ncbi:hypothetical protein HPC49_28960 [Pyxidicoccus fallax]|uniref:Lipoprotein n=1 Tax=Pyxidicoccus fallax TaxID=394095 RepID=A0A848LGQ1_9BACT|nr:hypothetical protein [Pyxidicoccus fallax]NMO16575.1 hypothetical protein [Pyxidicoccus fallax]NPC82235.1 hypothetical protein [Pyxidicoccus fallax]
MLTRWFWFITLAVACAWPSAAQACSCKQTPGDLATQLRTAQGSAVAIYRARVTDVDWGIPTGEATVEVLEVFKGPVKPGEELDLPAGGGGDCTVAFKEGTEYLIYAHGKDATSVGMCSRTRSVDTGTDSELVWLRTGKLPPLPVALQREAISCESCDIHDVGGRLVVPPGKAPGSFIGQKDAADAMEAGRPFFTYAHDDRMKRDVMVGMTFDGRPFELTLTSAPSPASACTQRVQLRWCKRLDVSIPLLGGAPTFECIEPGASSVQCDASTSRKSSYGRLEDLPTQPCRWRTSELAWCELAPEGRALPDGAPTSPVLMCRPRSANGSGGFHVCQVETKPGPTDKAP